MKPSRKVQSVYRNQNVLIRAVFERAGDSRKVLCVAIDYAKRKHVALICDGNGDVLKKSFPVENNVAGVAHLVKEISATARHRSPPLAAARFPKTRSTSVARTNPTTSRTSPKRFARKTTSSLESTLMRPRKTVRTF
jgi:hypothetical protein